MATPTAARKSANVPVGRQARLLALQALCAFDSHQEPHRRLDGGIRQDLQCPYDRLVHQFDFGFLLDWLCVDEPASAAVRRNAAGIIAGISDAAGNLDGIIQRYAPALPVSLLAIVDRNILRVAIYELNNRKELPHPVVVSEAVELAEMFGSESSARFVNGVLGSVMNDMISQEAPAVSDPAAASRID